MDLQDHPLPKPPATTGMPPPRPDCSRPSPGFEHCQAMLHHNKTHQKKTILSEKKID